MSPFASTILAFEPNPHSFAVLQTNARLNPEMGLIPYNVGVGSDGSADFFFGGVSSNVLLGCDRCRGSDGRPLLRAGLLQRRRAGRVEDGEPVPHPAALRHLLE